MILHTYQQNPNLRDVHLDRVPLAVEEEVHMELRVAARPDPLIDEDAHVLPRHHEYGVLERYTSIQYLAPDGGTCVYLCVYIP